MDIMIWYNKLLKIWKDRRYAISKFTNEYDAKVYNPQIEAIQKECGEMGHHFSYQDICVNCGAFNSERISNAYCKRT